MQAGSAGIVNRWPLAIRDHPAFFIQTPAACPAIHLQQLVGAQPMLCRAVVEGRCCDVDTADGEIDAGCESHRCHNHAQLPRLGQRFDDARPRRVGESAVVVGDPFLQQCAEFLPTGCALLLCQRKRLALWQVIRQAPGDGLGVLASWRKDQQGSKVGEQDRRGELWPEGCEVPGHSLWQCLPRGFLQWHWTFHRGDDPCIPTQTDQPVRHILRIGHRAAQHEQSAAGWRQRNRSFIVTAPGGVSDHLILIDDQQRGSIAAHQALQLRLQGRYHDRRTDILRDVAGRNAHIPAGVLPLGILVIGQGACRHRVDRLTSQIPRLVQQLEDVGFSGPGRSTDDHIRPFAQPLNRLMLPSVWKFELIEGAEHGK